MTLVIKTEGQYKALFEELAKAIGASIQVSETDLLSEIDSEEAVLDRVEKAYKQAKADERGDIKLNTLDHFLKSI